MLVGGAQHSAKSKNVLSDYIKNRHLLDEQDEPEGPRPRDRTPDEEEETAPLPRQQEAWKAKEQKRSRA